MKTNPIEIMVVGSKRVQVYFDRPNSNRSFQYTREDCRKIGAWGFKTGNMLDMMDLCVEQSVQVLSTGEIILTYDNCFITLKEQSVDFMVAIYTLLADIPEDPAVDECNQLQPDWVRKRFVLARVEQRLVPETLSLALHGLKGQSQYICSCLAYLKTKTVGKTQETCVELLAEMGEKLRDLVESPDEGEVTIERFLEELGVPDEFIVGKQVGFNLRIKLMRGYADKGFDFKTALMQTIKQHLTVDDKIELNKAQKLMEFLSIDIGLAKKLLGVKP